MGPEGGEPVRIALNVPGAHEVPRELMRRGVVRALEHEGVDEGEVSVTCLGDDAMRELNRTYLGHDRVTDVLAFPLHDQGEPPLGDVYIGVEQARRQAGELEIPFVEELVRLAIHGVLHVLGHDHPEGPREVREESPHYKLQERLTRQVMEEDR